MKRMNIKAHKKQNGHDPALQSNKQFKEDCNSAPRELAKREIEQEIINSQN